VKDLVGNHVAQGSFVAIAGMDGSMHIARVESIGSTGCRVTRLRPQFRSDSSAVAEIEPYLYTHTGPVVALRLPPEFEGLILSAMNKTLEPHGVERLGNWLTSKTW
jgi:hypothetical protein